MPAQQLPYQFPSLLCSLAWLPINALECRQGAVGYGLALMRCEYGLALAQCAYGLCPTSDAQQGRVSTALGLASPYVRLI
eukprot:scaffold142826_cov22-Tisochrysis_lutea.AAC.3